MLLKKVQLQDCKVKVGLEKPTCRCFTSHWARPQWDQWPGGPLCFWPGGPGKMPGPPNRIKEGTNIKNNYTINIRY